jgi:threonine/homoserine/homoserine lactone efflux protein
MDFVVVSLAVAFGVAVAAPIGPINLIVMRTALERGFLPGVAAGLGSVIGDALFAGIAAYGVRQVSDLVEHNAGWLGLAGGILLVAVGIHLACSHVDMDQMRNAPQPVSKSRIAKTFALTLSNPASFFGMLALFSGLGGALELAVAPYRPALAVAGVALGSLLWWTVVSGAVTLVRNRLPVTWIDRINRWTGVLIAAFGFLLIFEAWPALKLLLGL